MTMLQKFIKVKGGTLSATARRVFPGIRERVMVTTLFPTFTPKADLPGATLLFDNNNDDYVIGKVVKTRECTFFRVKRPSNLNKHHL